MSAVIAICAVCFAASLLGPMCGIGGGVIIKPVIDALGVMPVASVSFLSGVSVLTMALSTLIQHAAARKPMSLAPGVAPLALGSAAGGVAGKATFNVAAAALSHAELVGAAQAAVLIALSLAALAYTLAKDRIAPLRVDAVPLQIALGAVVGACWAFLGIGGGPFNLVMLGFFLAMESKPAASASLSIIACSQAASLLFSAASGSVPDVAPSMLACAAIAAVAGSVAGRRLAKRMDSAAVDRLYRVSLVLIAALSAWNLARFLELAA